MKAARSLVVDESDSGLRLDRWFHRHFPTLSHGRLQKLLRTGQVRVDGRRADAGDRLASGQVVRVPPFVDDAPQPSARGDRTIDARDVEHIRALVIHRDSDVIALNKPAGLAVQGGSGTRTHIDGMLDGLRFDAAERPRLVHRLDRDTTGLLLIARSAAAAAKLGAAFRGREAQKIYWAVVVGAPKPTSGRLDLSLAKRAGAARHGGEAMVVDQESGDRAITDYRILDRAGRKAALLELRPLTGRTHQLRVHCQALGCPILGDFKYGGEGARIAGQEASPGLHLHARSIVLPHPRGGTLSLSAELPAEFKATMAQLGFDAGEAGAAAPSLARGGWQP